MVSNLKGLKPGVITRVLLAGGERSVTLGIAMPHHYARRTRKSLAHSELLSALLVRAENNKGSVSVLLDTPPLCFYPFGFMLVRLNFDILMLTLYLRHREI